MTGVVNAFGEPCLALEAAGKTWTAVIDTGFNGDLELPESLKTGIKAEHQGKVLSVLAGGKHAVEDVYLVEFPFGGKTIIAEATFVSGQTILISTQLLRAYRLTIDFPARTVTLDRVRRPD